MTRPEVLEAVRATCESIVEGRGVEVVEVTLGREGRRQVLRVTLDRAGRPLTVDEIAEISEELSRALDVQDPIEGRYVLEVASAGIERPLVRPGDYHRFTGREVRVRCFEAIEGRRNFSGRIVSAGEESFVLDVEGERVEIPYLIVARARLMVDWDRELKGLGATNPGP